MNLNLLIGHKARRGISLTVSLLIGFAVLGLQGASATTNDHIDAGSSDSYSATKTLTRTNLDAGSDDVVDTRTVTVNVAETTDLHNLQQVKVSWSGAHPTGGIASDPNNPSSEAQEYPMAIFECRGTDSASAPAAQQLSQQTCWTVSSVERFQSDGNTAFPPYRLDRYETADDRAAIAGAPTPYPSACANSDLAERWIPFVAADGKTYPYGQSGCAGAPPEAGNYSSSVIPSNETFAATALDGTGSANFDVWTAEQNASLGCEQGVACSLVVVPIMGISCDPAGLGLPAEDRPAPGDQTSAATTACESPGGLTPGSRGSYQGVRLTDTGTYWWSASNWRNRFTIPLSFAPPGNICDVTNASDPTDIYGSELMTEATTQWEPAFCLNPGLFRLKHIQTGEPQAENLLNSGGIEAAFASDPPPGGFTVPTVNAPAALTGFAITYQILGASGNTYPNLRLTPRLLAKLLTESYPGTSFFPTYFEPSLSANPVNIASDPEFQALNPGISKNASQLAASTILFASEDSDVMTALTSYINADPEARSWLDGTPDPWGMTVNAAYKGISLPVTSWPLLDTTTEPGDQVGNPCAYYSPVPYLAQIEAPVLRYATVAQDVEYGFSTSAVNCSINLTDPSTSKVVPIGRGGAGSFVIGVATLADAARFDLPQAQLETQTTSALPAAGAKFTDATGRTFVAATDDAITAAATYLTADETSHSWQLDYVKLRQAAGGASAYPGTMLVNTSVPTSGLSATDATRYAQFLSFTAGAGQTPGTGQGQLPEGYVPLTAANGLGRFSAYTVEAAAAVQAQNGDVPSLEGASPTASVAPSVPAASTSGTGTAGSAARSPASTSSRTPSSPKSLSSASPSPPGAVAVPTGGQSTSVPATAPGTTSNGRSSSIPHASAAQAIPSEALPGGSSLSDPAGPPALTSDTSSSLGANLFPLLLLLILASGAASTVVRRRRT